MIGSMRGFTLWQPWASLVAVGEKGWETRGWRTEYRGLIAIHAAARWTGEQVSLCRTFPFLQLLVKHGLVRAGDLDELRPHVQRRRVPERMPFGAVVAIAELTDCIPGDVALHRFRLDEKDLRYLPRGPHEELLGNYQQAGADRFAWRLEHVRPLRVPFPMKGAQQLWAIDAGTRDVLLEQAAAA